MTYSPSLRNLSLISKSTRHMYSIYSGDIFYSGFFYQRRQMSQMVKSQVRTWNRLTFKHWAIETWLQGHKSQTVSLLVSVSLFLYIFFYRKWDWDKKWDHLTFMARSLICIDWLSHILIHHDTAQTVIVLFFLIFSQNNRMKQIY